MRHEIEPTEHGPLGEAMAAAVSKCVHCGFCLPACPTYQELGQETDSPRGRIMLMKEVLEGQLPVAQAAPHLDACLGCVACQPACPSEVPYGDLLSSYRATKGAQQPRRLGSRVKRFLSAATLPFPGRFRIAAWSGRLVKPLASVMPSSLAVMLQLLPDRLPAKVKLKSRSPAIGKQRGKVALLTGCAQSVLAPDINVATIDVLTRNGVEVVIPSGQGCCGALSWHVGDHAAAKKFAQANLQAFPSDVDAIVTNAAGCGSGMHEYPLILKGTGSESAAVQFADRVCDVTVYLDQLGELTGFPDSSRSRASVRVAYHDACHLSNAQRVNQPPRSLLAQVPGVQLAEIIGGQFCCGSAGTYNIDQPKIAGSLGRQKAEQVIQTDAQVVAMGNIGCMTQIEQHLNQAGSAIKVQHTMQVIRDAYLD